MTVDQTATTALDRASSWPKDPIRAAEVADGAMEPPDIACCDIAGVVEEQPSDLSA
jgi:hypothetical protein